MTASATHAQRMPRIQDGSMVRRQKRPNLHGGALSVEAWLVPVHEAWLEEKPARVMGAADEGPLAGQPVATVHRDRLPTRGRERGAKDDLRVPLQDLRRARIGQPG